MIIDLGVILADAGDQPGCDRRVNSLEQVRRQMPSLQHRVLSNQELTGWLKTTEDIQSSLRVEPLQGLLGHGVQLALGILSCKVIQSHLLNLGTLTSAAELLIAIAQTFACT